MKHYRFAFFFLLYIAINNVQASYENYDCFVEDYLKNKKLFSFKWLMNPEAEPVPDQGWKIHISCNIENLTTIIPPIVDKLLEKKIWFKIPTNLLHINVIYNEISQIGKIVTIYCKNSLHAVETAKWLDQTLMFVLKEKNILSSQARGIQNSVELKIGESGFLLARYGKLHFSEEKINGNHYITEKDGTVITLAMQQSSTQCLLKVLDENEKQIYWDEISVWTMDNRTTCYKPYFIKEEPFSKAGLKVVYPLESRKN